MDFHKNAIETPFHWITQATMDHNIILFSISSYWGVIPLMFKQKFSEIYPMKRCIHHWALGIQSDSKKLMQTMPESKVQILLSANNL